MTELTESHIQSRFCNTLVVHGNVSFREAAPRLPRTRRAYLYSSIGMVHHEHPIGTSLALNIQALVYQRARCRIYLSFGPLALTSYPQA